MLIIEQNLAQQQKIKKYKGEGYTELKLAAWQKKKKGDPNGTFVNVETYYYGYKPSNQQSSAENKKNENSPKKEQCPSTPFKNSTESDAFRTWLLKNYPDYEKKSKPYNVSAPPQPKYTNTTALRCAYEDKGKEYEAFLSKKPEDTKIDDEKKRKEELVLQQQYDKSICYPWEDNNFFENEYPGTEHRMALDFINFIEKKGRFDSKEFPFDIGRGVRKKLRKYAVCEKKHDDYVKEGIAHRSPWLRDSVEYQIFWNNEYKKLWDAWKSTLKQNESKIIRKKLLEIKEMKTIKESIRKKLSGKTKKIDVISENLYKVAGKFYNENYNEFFKKFEKLTENYKKSKLFLKEDSSESFNRALNKVFKGDEEKLKKEAIPFFINKLGLEGAIRTQVKNELDKKYGADNVGDMFLDCWADIVVQAFKDNAKSEISEPSNVMDAIEKIMVSKIDSPEFDYQLKKEICKMLKPAQEERQTKVQDLAKKLAQSIIDSSEA